MTAVVEARNAYKAARAEVTRTRLELGRAIVEARRADVAQADIARDLQLTREQIRRYEAEYRKWLEDNAN
jgi:uncharacterized protein (DUF433 family)